MSICQLHGQGAAASSLHACTNRQGDPTVAHSITCLQAATQSEDSPDQASQGLSAATVPADSPALLTWDRFRTQARPGDTLKLTGDESASSGPPAQSAQGLVVPAGSSLPLTHQADLAAWASSTASGGLANPRGRAQGPLQSPAAGTEADHSQQAVISQANQTPEAGAAAAGAEGEGLRGQASETISTQAERLLQLAEVMHKSVTLLSV